MKKKYDIIKNNQVLGGLYFKTKDNSCTGSIEDLEKQLIYDMKNGIEVEVCGKTLIPVKCISSPEDILEALFKEHGRDEDDPVYLTNCLYGKLSYKYAVSQGVKFDSICVNDKFYYFVHAKNKFDDNAGLPISEELKMTIKEIVNAARKEES